jgi:phosphatidylserine decarboxylase
MQQSENIIKAEDSMKKIAPRMQMLKYFQRGISQWVGWLCEREGGWLTRWAICIFIRNYKVNMNIAVREDYRDYLSFNDFFTRRLKANERPIESEELAIVSPVDGTISQVGRLQNKFLLQAKGKFYDLVSLLGDDPVLSAEFEDGYFLTTYLAPGDYHRIHMPCEGRLLKTIYIPGYLFSAKQRIVNQVDGLFSKNERLVCVFETPYGPMVLVMVGALLVGNICTAWQESKRHTHCNTQDYSKQNLVFQRGEEIGYFTMGSTVITLFTKGSIEWSSTCQETARVRFGEKVGEAEITEAS